MTPFDEIAALVHEKEGLPDTTPLPTIEELASALTGDRNWVTAAAGEYANRLSQLAGEQWQPGTPLPLQHGLFMMVSCELMAPDRAKADAATTGLIALHVLLENPTDDGLEEDTEKHVMADREEFFRPKVADGLRAVCDLYLDAFRERGEAPEPKHPLAPVIKAWLNRPTEVETNTHPRPLLPHIRVVGEAPERGRLFGLVPEGRSEAQLPLFGPPAQPGGIIDRVPLLGIADATTGGTVTAQGRGAPLELAVPVEAMLSVRQQDRRLTVVRIAVTVRELQDSLWPNGWRRQHDWPRLQQVLRGLNTQYVPWRNGGEWYPLVLRGLPSKNASLDELIILDLALPPGTDQGTPINRQRLSELRVHSGGAYRAMIATSALAWQPGRTRVRTPSGRTVWTTDPTRYPIYTRQDRREIVFGVSDRKNRTRVEIDGPFERLAEAGDIVIASRDAIDPENHSRGWRIAPAAADTEGLRKRAPARAARAVEAEHGNRRYLAT